MLRTDNKKVYEALNGVLVSNNWGTIGRYSVNAADMIASRVAPDGSYGAVLCDSTYAALETIIRGYFIGHGDKVIVPALSSPYIAQTAATVGCSVVFADIEKGTCVISPDWIEGLMDESVKAVICEDYCGYPCDYDKIKAVLPEGVKLIVCTSDPFNTLYNGVSTIINADAAVAAFDEGCAVECDCAAVVMKKEDYNTLWSMHHCGNLASGTNMEALNAGYVPGGDERICEWKSALLIKELEAFWALPAADANAYPYKEEMAVVENGARSPYLRYFGKKHYAMNLEESFKSEYYVKSSGYHGVSICPLAQKAAK